LNRAFMLKAPFYFLHCQSRRAKKVGKSEKLCQANVNLPDIAGFIKS